MLHASVTHLEVISHNSMCKQAWSENAHMKPNELANQRIRWVLSAGVWGCGRGPVYIPSLSHAKKYLHCRSYFSTTAP